MLLNLKFENYSKILMSEKQANKETTSEAGECKIMLTKSWENVNFDL